MLVWGRCSSLSRRANAFTRPAAERRAQEIGAQIRTCAKFFVCLPYDAHYHRRGALAKAVRALMEAMEVSAPGRDVAARNMCESGSVADTEPEVPAEHEAMPPPLPGHAEGTPRTPYN